MTIMTTTEIQEIIDDNAFTVELQNGFKEAYPFSLAIEYVNKKHGKSFSDESHFEEIGEGAVISQSIRADGTVDMECELYNISYEVDSVAYNIDYIGVPIKVHLEPYIDSDGYGALKVLSSSI